MDLRGQDLAAWIYQLVVVGFAVLGFLLGWALGDISVTLLVFLVGVAVAAALVVPDWPMYNKMQIRYLKSDRKVHSKSLADRLLGLLH